MQTLYHSSFLFGISRWGHIFFARCVNIVVKQFFAQGFDQLAIAICPRFFCLQDAVIASCRANADASGSMTQTRPFGSFVDRLFFTRKRNLDYANRRNKITTNTQLHKFANRTMHNFIGSEM